ncbi:MAG: type II secretion system F family protein [Streptosporangiaceae bacterium]
MSQQGILAVLAGTLVLLVLALNDLFNGWEQRRRLAGRSHMEGDRKVAGPVARLDSAIRRTEVGQKVAKRIVASGVRISVLSFLALMTAGILGTVFLIGSWVAPVFGVAAAVGVGFIFFGFLRRKEERRKEEFIAQLPELARVLSNATSAGLVLRTALEIATEELAEPARSELKHTADALRLGQSVEDALRELGERLPSRELAVLVSTLVVSARAGGSLVTALRQIAGTLEQRKEIRREVKTIMGEAVVTNYAIGGLGLGAILMVNLISPNALRNMSEDLIGQIMLAAAAGFFILSLVIIRGITRIDV